MTNLRLVEIEGKVDADNSSTTPLGIGSVFTGSPTEILNCGIVFVNVTTDQASAIDGLSIQQSSDGTNWDHDDSYTVSAGSSKNYGMNPHAKYYRVVYTNGAVAQTVFRIQSICKGNAKPSSHRIKDEISGNDDCELVKAALTGENGGGMWHNVRVNSSGVMLSANFLLEVAAGNVPGYSPVNKFGHNPLVLTGGADVWAGGGTYSFYPTTAQSMEIVSQDGNDTNGGTGAWTVTVFGLDSNWDEQSETVTMNGTTPVALSNAYIRMNRAIVITAGTLETNAGLIAVQESGGGAVGVVIGTGDGQTQQAIYTIPNGKTGYFIKGYVGLGNDNKNGEDGTFQWKVKPNNIANAAWQVKGHMVLINVGSSHWQYEYGVPAGPIPAKSDIKIEVLSASATIDAVGGFDLILIDN